MTAIHRVIWIVLDSVGIGALPDAADYDDVVWLLTDTSVARDCTRPANVVCRLLGRILADPAASVHLPLRPASLHPRAPPLA